MSFHPEIGDKFGGERSNEAKYTKICIYTMFARESPSICCFHSRNVCRRSSGQFGDPPKMLEEDEERGQETRAPTQQALEQNPGVPKGKAASRSAARPRAMERREAAFEPRRRGTGWVPAQRGAQSWPWAPRGPVLTPRPARAVEVKRRAPNGSEAEI